MENETFGITFLPLEEKAYDIAAPCFGVVGSPCHSNSKLCPTSTEAVLDLCSWFMHDMHVLNLPKPHRRKLEIMICHLWPRQICWVVKGPYTNNSPSQILGFQYNIAQSYVYFDAGVSPTQEKNFRAMGPSTVMISQSCIVMWESSSNTYSRGISD